MFLHSPLIQLRIKLLSVFLPHLSGVKMFIVFLYSCWKFGTNCNKSQCVVNRAGSYDRMMQISQKTQSDFTAEEFSHEEVYRDYFHNLIRYSCDQ